MTRSSDSKTGWDQQPRGLDYRSIENVHVLNHSGSTSDISIVDYESNRSSPKSHRKYVIAIYIRYIIYNIYIVLFFHLKDSPFTYIMKYR